MKLLPIEKIGSFFTKKNACKVFSVEPSLLRLITGKNKQISLEKSISTQIT